MLAVTPAVAPGPPPPRRRNPASSSTSCFVAASHGRPRPHRRRARDRPPHSRPKLHHLRLLQRGRRGPWAAHLWRPGAVRRPARCAPAQPRTRL